jgi:hypothetical protein
VPISAFESSCERENVPAENHEILELFIKATRQEAIENPG